MSDNGTDLTVKDAAWVIGVMTVSGVVSVAILTGMLWLGIRATHWLLG